MRMIVLTQLEQPVLLYRLRKTNLTTHEVDFIYYAVLALACCGGALHGAAMALRKSGGDGQNHYYLEWRWWLGTVTDAIAGAMIWPAMPLVSVQILVPLIIVVQLGASYIFGLLFFEEKCVLRTNLGLAVAAAGIIGVSLTTDPEAADFSMSDFESRWVSMHFMAANVIVLLTIAASFGTLHRSTAWALAAAALEGIQYICSRSLVDSVFEFHSNVFAQPIVFAVIGLKITCILFILHFQQLGLAGDLSRFAAIYLASCTLFICTYGVVFFGDKIGISFGFVASALLTLGGIWLLNQADDTGDSKDALLKNGKDGAEGKAASRTTAWYSATGDGDAAKEGSVQSA